MKAVVAVVLFLSSGLFMSQTASGEEQPSTGELQPPRYVPGQGEAGKGPDLRDRVLTERERRVLERNEIRRQRKIEKLHKIMAVEGNEFSQEKYDTYNRRMVGGITLVILGGTSVIASFIVWVSRPYDYWNYNSEGCSGYECEKDKEEYDKKQRASSILAVGGLVSVGIGIPFIVSGRRGKNRQLYLKRKNRILASFRSVQMKLNFDPSTNSGGFALSASF